MPELTFDEELKALLKKYNKAIICAVVPKIVDVKETEKKDVVQ